MIIMKNLFSYKLFIGKFKYAYHSYFTCLMVSLGIVLIATPSQATEEQEMGCLMEAIYFEARSESFAGMIAVGQVILNRVRAKRYPNTICSVVHDGLYWEGNPVKYRCAFTYWCDGKPERYGNLKALDAVQKVVIMLLAGVRIIDFDYVTHYHASYVEPYWSRAEDFIYIAQIGKHLFYETLYDH